MKLQGISEIFHKGLPEQLLSTFGKTKTVKLKMLDIYLFFCCIYLNSYFFFLTSYFVFNQTLENYKCNSNKKRKLKKAKK